MRDKIREHISEVERLLYDDTRVALNLATEAVELSKKYRYEDLLAVSTMLKGTLEFNNGNITSGTELLNEALIYATNTKDALTVGRCYNVLGTIHNHQGAFEEALDCYFGYYDSVKALNMPLKEGAALNNIGEIYRRIGDAESAFEYYESAISRVKNNPEVALYKICYLNKAETLIDLGETKRAKATLERLQVEAGQGHTVITGFIFGLLGNIESIDGNPELAEEHYQRAMDLAVKGGKSIENMQIVFNYAKHHHKYGDDDKALILLQMCLDESLGIRGADFIIEVTDVMRSIYESKGWFDECIKVRELQLKTFHELRDFQRQMRSDGIKRQADIKRLQEIHDETKKSNEELIEKHQSILDEKSALENELKYLQLVNLVGRDIGRTRDVEEIVRLLYKRINELFDFDLAGIGRIDGDDVELIFITESLDINRRKFNRNTNIIPKVVEGKSRVVINDLSKEYDRFYSEEEYKSVAKNRFPSKSVLYEPLMFEDECIGVLTLHSKEAGRICPDVQSVSEIIASFTAISMKNNMTFEALNQEIDEREKTSSELLRVNRILEQQANMDGLTGVFNKRTFSQELMDSWLKAKDENTALGMMIIDIDDFKNYNDNYGHLKGDDIIKLVANTLMEELPDDFIARFGGEEFVVMMEDVDELKMVTAASSILNAVKRHKEPHEFSGVADYITVSIGVGLMKPGDNDKSADFFAFVDELMYKAKELGKNQYYTNFYDEVE